MARIFVSDAILEERLVIQAERRDEGTGRPRHPEWKALSALYRDSLAACGYDVAPVARPEIYQTAIARQILGARQGDRHLAVKPIEHLRPFHGLPNLYVCDWAFPELSNTPYGGDPFADQVRVLRMADAVLCCTDFTRDALRAAGVDRAMTMPPHVPSPTGAAPPRASRHGGRFLGLVAPGRARRQLQPMLAGFIEAARQRAGLSLVIHVQDDEPRLHDEVVACVAGMTRGVLADGVVDVRAGPIRAGQIEGLFDDADFFLQLDVASGLCLPLVQAMLDGVPLVTSRHSGTASFLPPEAAVTIETGEARYDGEDEPIARDLKLTCHPPLPGAVRDAVLAAAALDGAARAQKAMLARSLAGQRFGIDAFAANVEQLTIRLARNTP